jgi:nicotinamide mononucleotide (NMN) deamidase PncC
MCADPGGAEPTKPAGNIFSGCIIKKSYVSPYSVRAAHPHSILNLTKKGLKMDNIGRTLVTL